MEYKELVQSALQALRTNVLRTLLTMLGIIIGISAVILIVSIGQGAVTFVTDELTSFGTNMFSINQGNTVVSSVAGGTKTLTMEDVDSIRKDITLTNIDVVAPVAIVSVTVSANDIARSLLVQGVTEDMLYVLKPTIDYGEFISLDDDLESRRVAVLGIDASETFFGKDTDPVGEKIQIDNKNFTVIGVAESSSVLAGGMLNNSLYIPISVAMNEIEGNVELHEVDVSVKNTDLINQTIADVEELLRDRHKLKPGEENDFIIQSMTDALTTVQTITNLLTTMVATISAISLIVGGVGVMNIMLVSVTERTKEIGLLKAIGARDRDIMIQFLIESVLMTVIGGIIGILIGVGGAFVISRVVGIPFVVSILSICVAVGVSMGVGLIFGLYPAKRAAGLSPIDALRRE